MAMSWSLSPGVTYAFWISAGKLVKNRSSILVDGLDERLFEINDKL